MNSFSQRYGYVPVNNIQLESIDTALRNRLWNSFLSREFPNYYLDYEDTTVENLMDKLGLTYTFPTSNFDRKTNLEKLKKYLFSSDWYVMYDFIEKYLSPLDKSQANTISKQFNTILEEECSAYRIVRGLITPIMNKTEIKSIEDASKSKYSVVGIHIDKALGLFSRKKNPDYENSIKESISAVESLCCIIADDDKATLGSALRKLESKGVKLHASFKAALDKLYGYTSDENGIRHAGIDFKEASSEDARYMLITCSAFVNYLSDKLAKVK